MRDGEDIVGADGLLPRSGIIEHPELVAQRLLRYADAVGKTNVIAGTDCGFATIADTTIPAGTVLSRTDGGGS